MKSLGGEIVVLLCYFLLKHSHSEDTINILKGKKKLNSLPRTTYGASIQMQFLVTFASFANKKYGEGKNLNVHQPVNG